MNDPMTVPYTEDEERAMSRYQAALHAMQTGVAYEMGLSGRHPDTEPKHLRVGINAAMVEHSALVRLLVRKGLISRAEYFDALSEAMEEEVARYQSRAPKGVTFL